MVLGALLLAPSIWMLSVIPPLWNSVDTHVPFTAPPGILTMCKQKVAAVVSYALALAPVVTLMMLTNCFLVNFVPRYAWPMWARTFFPSRFGQRCNVHSAAIRFSPESNDLFNL
jgi:hypothetical protein